MNSHSEQLPSGLSELASAPSDGNPLRMPSKLCERLTTKGYWLQSLPGRCFMARYFTQYWRNDTVLVQAIIIDSK